MLFGENMKKGIIFNGSNLEVVIIGENGIQEKDVLIHNESEEDPTLHTMISRMRPPIYPVALGVIRAVKQQTFDNGMLSQIEYEKTNAKFKSVDELLSSGETWEV